MKKNIVGLVGAGGFARGIAAFVKKRIVAMSLDSLEADFELFLVETSPAKKNVNGYKVLSEKEFFDFSADAKYFNIAIADSRVREEIATRFIANDCEPLTFRAPSAVVYDENVIGEGAIICDNCMITSNTKIGKFFHANIYSYVEHDCEIGDYVTFAPRVSCNGRVKIENHAYIGAGAVIKEGEPGRLLVIGEGAVVGMGAVVTKDVPAHTVVVGNPARPLQKKN